MNEQCKGEEESNRIVLVLVGVTLTDDPLLQFCIYHKFTTNIIYVVLFYFHLSFF